MTQRDVYSLIERALRDGKQRLAAGDRALMGEVLNGYELARRRISMEIAQLEQQILWSIANNNDQEITEAWVRRQAWYEHLEDSIFQESKRLEDLVRTQTTSARGLGIQEARTTWSETRRAAPFMRQVNVPAMTRWTASIQPASPLDKVLTNYGAKVDKVLRREITQGIVQGQGRGSIVQQIMAGTDEAISEYDASRIVRTELMRTYRGVYEDQLEALTPGMVTGYRWISALDFRTCPICIGLHGQVFKDYPNYFHVQCRCTVAPVFSERYAPPREYQTGEAWLRGLPVEEQQKVLGQGERFEIWQQGKPLNEMVRFRQDPVWGGDSRLIPLKDLRP